MIKQILKEMRLKQWTKNSFVYAALLFNGSLFNPEKFLTVSIIFIAFCLLSSSVYFFNDIFDYESDRVNPDKKNRPIASGAISISLGYFIAIILFLAAMFISYSVSFECFCLLLSYAVINIFYTIKLKNFVIIDVMIIAYGFVARALTGAQASDVFLTEWFILCVMFLSLFLALGKRRHELLSVKNSQRKVLKSYSVELIDQMTTIIAASLTICYALFAMNTSDKSQMIFTIPMVLYGLFYYLYIVRVKNRGGAPDVALYKEKPILMTVLIYVAAVIFIRDI